MDLSRLQPGRGGVEQFLAGTGTGEQQSDSTGVAQHHGADLQQLEPGRAEVSWRVRRRRGRCGEWLRATYRPWRKAAVGTGSATRRDNWCGWRTDRAAVPFSAQTGKRRKRWRAAHRPPPQFAAPGPPAARRGRSGLRIPAPARTPVVGSGPKPHVGNWPCGVGRSGTAWPDRSILVSSRPAWRSSTAPPGEDASTRRPL